MSDTFIAVQEATANKNIIFGKNSDRNPNEAQTIIRIPAKKNTESTVKCTHIEIPQVKETFELILSKPYNTWGAEMGANEYSVVIGNEAIMSKFKPQKNNTGLTGLDLLRLALERSKSAQNALENITSLIEKYGQSAYGFSNNKYLNFYNSFLITDKNEGWLLETADNHWVAEQIKGFRSVSNGFTIQSKFDLSSKGLADFAFQNKLIGKGEEFNFSKAFSHNLFSKFSNCEKRQFESSKIGTSKILFSVQDAIEILTHHTNEKISFSPSKCTTSSICMHPTGYFNPFQTNGSMIAEIRKENNSTYWFTGTSNPCLSVYKPFFIPGTNILEENFTQPNGTFDNSMWWKAEKLHRLINRNYAELKKLLKNDINALRQQVLRMESEVLPNEKDSTKLSVLSNHCLEMYEKKLSDWDNLLNQFKFRHKKRYFFQNIYQNKLNRKAKLE